MTTLAETESLERIADAHAHHSRIDLWWTNENSRLEESRLDILHDLQARQGLDVGPLGFVPFTYVEMGAINSLDLFGLDELILFAFYWRNRDRYRRVVDMGANIGLHSVLLARMGFSVTSYEPDPNHARTFLSHVALNDVNDRVSLRQAAVARESGRIEFVRVLGNTTGSHVAGAKRDPYGDLETFEVEAVAFADALVGADLVKMDVEGLEADLLCSIGPEAFASVDLVCEVGTAANAERIWECFDSSDLNLFPQKLNWAPATSAADLPVSYREGSLFVSTKSVMPWNEL